MIVNKSMFPVQTGFSVVSQMQQKLSDLQMQMGSGQKSSTLGGMGRDLPLSLSVRSRLDKIEGYEGNIDNVDLRLSFLDKTMTRFDKIEGEARTSINTGDYGTNDINMATIPGLSYGRLDEIVTLLNQDVAGRYLFGGNVTDKPPVKNTDVLLDGEGGRLGYRSILSERLAADQGTDGMGRLTLPAVTAGTGTVHLAQDGTHPFGFKLSTISTNGAPAITVTQPTGTPPDLSVTFSGTEPTPGQHVIVGMTLPDGSETQITLTATDDATPGDGLFQIDADPDVMANNFRTALETSIKQKTGGELKAASTYEAAENFFDSNGVPKRVSGGVPATTLVDADPNEVVFWYDGQTPAISADGLGRTNINTATDTVTLARTLPTQPDHGFQSLSLSGSTANITTDSSNPNSVSIKFNALPVAGETVKVDLVQPDGTKRSFSLKAVTGTAGPGEFTIGTGATTADAINNTAAAFGKALDYQMTNVATVAEGSPRTSVAARVDDGAQANYGIEARESGLLKLLRTQAAMTVTTYPTEADVRARPDIDAIHTAAMALPDDDTRVAKLAEYEAAVTAGYRVSRDLFDGMAVRQQGGMSEAHNSEPGSIERITMDLSVASMASHSASERHTNYKNQLENLLTDVETVSQDETAMKILALQTRLQASYQVTASVSKLSLSNYM